MIKLATAAILAGAFLQDDPVVATALRDYKHPWADFAEGATVTYKDTVKRPEIDQGGNLVLRDVETQMVWTVGPTEGGKVVLKVASDGRESEFPHHLSAPGWSKGKGERKPDEEIAVGGSKFGCRVTAILIDLDKDASQVATIWQNPEAPGWAVRFRNETFAKGRRNTAEEESLVALEEKVKVGDREVACHVLERKTEVEGELREIRKEWRSGEVPGRVVRREVRHYRGGREITAAASKMEVVSFKSRK